MVTGGYKGLQGVKEGYKRLQGVTRDYRWLKGVTGDHKGLQRVTRDYGMLQGIKHAQTNSVNSTAKDLGSTQANPFPCSDWSKWVT